jgi:hypothetical protein
MEISQHIHTQCARKHIPFPVVQMVIDKKVGIHTTVQSPMKRDYKCEYCGKAKQEWRNYSPVKWQGQEYSVKVVVCVPCDVAITVYPDERNEGNTPIHDYQWERGTRQFSAKCYECGKRFVIRSTSWEVCERETTHNCKGTTRHIMKKRNK